MRDKDLDTVFRESFSKKPEEIFKSFNRIPTASASIGQVHEATLQDGTKVAVKVQYPKIVKAIKSDFKNIDQIKKLLLLIFPNLPNVDNYLHELKDNLFLECDYNYEADNINWFRDHLMPLVEGIYIPQVFSDYSSSTILTMEFVEGDSYEETKHYSQESRNYLGQVLYNFHMTTLYQLNKMHTDPQNGNYLFQPDKIILLDFGSIKKFPPDFIDLYIKLIQSIENKDLNSYKELIKAVGFLTEQDDEPHIEKHFELVSQLYLPYTKEGIFCIDPQNPFQMIDTFAKSISLKGRSTPRQEFLLLDRANLGLYTKLKYWKSEIDWVSKKEEVWENFYK